MRSCIVLAALLAGCGGESAPPPVPATVPPVEVKAPEAPPAAAKPDFATMSDTDKKAYLMKVGENVFTTGGNGGVACVTCHQADGKGIPSAFPPLVGQKAIMGDCQKHAGIVVYGYTGELVVDGATFNGAMPAQANLTDEEIAGAITYERSSFGNDFGACMPADVAAARNAPAPKLP